MVKKYMKNFNSKRYDFVYLTNTPSFYKVNLCNEIAKKNSLLLVLYGYGSEAVNLQLNHNNFNFDFYFLHTGNSDERNKIKTFLSLIRLLLNINFKKLLFSGWFVPEYNLLSFITPKSKNCVICESSINESSFSGLKGWLKKRIISQMSVALPSGQLHQAIFSKIGFKGEIYTTGGVGIFNKGVRQFRKEIITSFKYLYVGRLIEVKNLSFLINLFNKNGKQLTIVGNGELEDELHLLANNNISFLGFIDNEKLSEIYQTHHIFILPSYSEPWGLVVDEALYYGLPVIVCDQVGCSIDLVKLPVTGCIFENSNSESLQNCINEVEKNYEKYRCNVRLLDFDERDVRQVKVYTQLIKD